MTWELILNGILLGVGLAMDACAVSMANGLNEPKMKLGKTCLIAGAFAFFQALMPMIGWVCVYFVAHEFEVFYVAVPYIALALLAFIGGKMIFEGVKEGREQRAAAKTEGETADTTEAATTQETAADENEVETTAATTATAQETTAAATTAKTLTLWVLFTQAIATSIDALSVGFTTSHYEWWQALIQACIIAAVTFAISFGAVFIGKKFGTKLGNKAEILGGIILVGIGLEIFITGVFF